MANPPRRNYHWRHTLLTLPQWQFICHKGKSGFTYNDKFELYTEHWVRIKILKPQGVSQADVAIPYYVPSDRDKEKDRISDLDGCSYNLENGKRILYEGTAEDFPLTFYQAAFTGVGEERGTIEIPVPARNWQRP